MLSRHSTTFGSSSSCGGGVVVVVGIVVVMGVVVSCRESSCRGGCSSFAYGVCGYRRLRSSVVKRRVNRIAFAFLDIRKQVFTQATNERSVSAPRTTNWLSLYNVGHSLKCSATQHYRPYDEPEKSAQCPESLKCTHWHATQLSSVNGCSKHLYKQVDDILE